MIGKERASDPGASAAGASAPQTVRTALRAVLLLAALLLAPVAARAETPVPADRLAGVLSTIARGQDPVFGATVAPALSADPGLAAAARADRAIQRISQEISLVVSAFASAAPGTQIAAARAAVARVSAETARDGASRSFEGGGPSVSLLRQLMFVPTQNAGPSPAARVMDIISQFERSPKTDDTYYEYSDPRNLKAPVTELPGSDASWTTKARPPMTPGKLYALKKCRHILVLGWFCNTQLYEVRELPGSPAVRLLLTFLRPLPAGADNPAFSGGKAQNIVDGYTAAYVVVPSGGLVLVYNLGIQSRPDTASEQSRLNEGQKAEYRELVRRLEASIGTPKLPY